MAAIASILDSVKKNLGLASDYDAFDPDIIMYINSTFARLHQLGIGPELGFAIEDDTITWDAFLGSDKTYNNVKTYVYLKVKSLFDPPATGFHMTAMTEQIRELEVLINTHREDSAWTAPPTIVDEDDDIFIDGGGA